MFCFGFSQLPRYVRMVDQLMLAHLVKLVRHCVTEFVYKTLEIGVAAPRDGFFKAKLVFSDEGLEEISIRKTLQLF